MKKDAKEGKKQLETTFNQLRKNTTRKVDEELLRKIRNKHKEDVKTIVRLIEEKITDASSILRMKIGRSKKMLEDNVTRTAQQVQNQISRVEQKFEGKLKNISLSECSQQDFQRLEKKIGQNKKNLVKSLHSDKELLKNLINTKVAYVNGMCQGKINVIRTQLQNTERKIQDLYGKFNRVKVAQWPSGSYCILQSGNCPAGFTSHHGFMYAIKMFSTNSKYLRAMNFGNSRIYDHGDHTIHANFDLWTCCK